MTSKELFDQHLAEWKRNEDALAILQEKRGELVNAVNEIFAKVVTEEQMLAGLPWRFEVYARGSNLSCEVRDTAVMGFLDQLHWDRIGWHSAIKIGEHYVSVDDGHMSISLESVDALIAFCKEQGIKPDVSHIRRQQDSFQEKADHFSKIIRKLSEENSHDD